MRCLPWQVLFRAADPTVWIMHARRHARDYELLIQHSESLITWAAITLMDTHDQANHPNRRLSRSGCSALSALSALSAMLDACSG